MSVQKLHYLLYVAFTGLGWVGVSGRSRIFHRGGLDPLGGGVDL